MLRSVFVAMALSFIAVGQGHAGWITQYATIQGGRSGGTDLSETTFVNRITGQAGGNTFTNTISHTTGGTEPGELRRVVVVGSVLLSDTYVRSILDPPFSVSSYYDGNPIVAAFALEGTATTITGPGDAVALFDTGRMGFFNVTPSGSFLEDDPLTWGATTADGLSLNTPLAVWDLFSPASVAPGTIDGVVPDPFAGFNLSASEMNRSAINTVAGTNTQGNFLFQETTTYLGDTVVGNDFINITGPDLINPVDEGLVVNTAQQIVIPSSPFGLTQLAALNTIALELGGLTNGFGFATGLGGALATDYNLAANNPAGTGDLQATLGVTMAPVAVIPEPASIAVWTLMILSALPIARRRMRR